MLKVLLTLFIIILTVSLWADDCIECHSKKQLQIVNDWKLSKHAENDVDCATCHGDAHNAADNAKI